MPNALDEKFAPFRNKHSTAARIYDDATGLRNDLALKKIETDSNRRLSADGKRDELRDAATAIAQKLQAHTNTLASATARNGTALATLAGKAFKPDTDVVKAMWSMRVFDRLDAMDIGKLSPALANDPELLRIVATAPIKPKNLPAVEFDRLVAAHLAATQPDAVADINNEAEALSIAKGNLQTVTDSLQAELGFGQDFSGFARWMENRAPTKEEKAAVAKQTNQVEADRLIEIIREWSFDDRRPVFDAILRAQEVDVMGKVDESRAP